jgi:predicted O-linked N-acetylglucosamine transferase (SPINDLY family)
MAPHPAELLQAALASHRIGHLDHAERLYRAVLRIEPANVNALSNLSVICLARGAIEDALKLTNKAINASPTSAAAHCNHGNALRKANRDEGAIRSYERALELQPSMAAARRNLGNALLSVQRWTDAANCFQQVVANEPDLAAGYRGLADACVALGLPEEAVANYDKALVLEPDAAPTRSNLLMCLNYLQGVAPDSIRAAHEGRWNAYNGRYTLPAWRTASSSAGRRRLRVGYVSADFRRHSVSFFFAPLLAAHDPSRVEIFCYADVPQPDGFTRRLKAEAEHWSPIDGIADDRVADRIRNDGIDILVDLAGHTGHNRLGVFARKPAPVQATWLGYPNTTGLSTIDYRITDAIADPDGDQYYTETLFRLPRCFLCYSPLDDAPPVNMPPSNATGKVTFGSFNDLNKINAAVIAVWARLLSSIPDTSLLLKARQFGDATVRDRVAAQVRVAGVDPQRVTMLGHVASQAEHLATYGGIDIALDTFPYNGTTTTCEALWMGIPVVTLRGDRHAGRVGATLLTAAGLSEFIAREGDDYIAIARRLAQDPARLAALRHGLRERLFTSPLCDGTAFARAMETAYNEMWKRWHDRPESVQLPDSPL